MTETSVKLMQCVVASEGVLKIERIGVGVGVIMYSSVYKKCVGVHVLAPRSSEERPDNPAKYANTAIPYAIEQMSNNGARPPFTVAIAGGGSMFDGPSSMGPKNVEAVKAALTKANLAAKVDQTGGKDVRNMTFDIQLGKISVK